MYVCVCVCVCVCACACRHRGGEGRGEGSAVGDPLTTTRYSDVCVRERDDVLTTQHNLPPLKLLVYALLSY